MNKVVNKHIVVPVKDKKGKVKSFEQGKLLRSGLVISDNHLKEFNNLSHQTRQRYYIDEELTKKLN